MEERSGSRTGSLRHVVGSTGLFMLAFGGMVGSAWVIILGQWLELAGPVGAIIGICAGGLAMAVISLSYTELMSRMPVAGGEIVYTFEVFGFTPAYYVGWFTILPLVGNVIFEGIALTWMVSAISPTFGNITLYTVLGHDVSLVQLLLGVAITTLIAVQNYIGVKNAVLLQSILTISFFVIAVFAISCGLIFGYSANLHPLFLEGAKEPWWAGSAAIFATGVVWFAGFQAVPQVIEERSENVSFRSTAIVMVLAIAVAAVFYAVAILSVAMAKPWPSLLHENLVTAAALHDLLPGGILSTIVLVAGALAAMKLWNAGFVVASRVLLVMARAQFVPQTLARIHPKYGTPSVVIVFLALINIAGVALGSGAIMLILDTCSICIAIAIFMALVDLIVLRLRGAQPAPYPVPGGWVVILAGFAGILVLGGATIVTPYLHSKGTFPFEWKVLIAWAAIGVCYLAARRKKLAAISHSETRAALLNQAPEPAPAE